MATACRSAPNKLCLLCVQLQPIARRPAHDIVDALRHVGLERAGIRQRGPAVDLGVICIQMRMQTVISDQWGEIGGVQHKKQGPQDGALRHPELDVLLRCDMETTDVKTTDVYLSICVDPIPR